MIYLLIFQICVLIILITYYFVDTIIFKIKVRKQLKIMYEGSQKVMKAIDELKWIDTKYDFIRDFAVYVYNKFISGCDYVESNQTNYGSNPSIGDINKDDHLTYWQSIKEVLERAGYEVVASSNARDGIKVYKNKKEVE